MPEGPADIPEGPAETPQVIVALRTIAAEWARIGCVGFGGPPAHIALLRALCVERKGWLSAAEFEDGVATTNLLPGPASTQLAIFCAWRLAGPAGALVGGVCFIVPGLTIILALSAVFLAARPPLWIRGAGAGAGAGVPAVAASAAIVLALAASGLLDMVARGQHGPGRGLPGGLLPLLAAPAATAGTLLSLAWVAFKVGALSYGGGFVIIPLMQRDAVHT